jgi:hypothetical protein
MLARLYKRTYVAKIQYRANPCRYAFNCNNSRSCSGCNNASYSSSVVLPGSSRTRWHTRATRNYSSGNEPYSEKCTGISGTNNWVSTNGLGIVRSSAPQGKSWIVYAVNPFALGNSSVQAFAECASTK